jgi:predicted aldo/keto reductase-like oxidoreductase
MNRTNWSAVEAATRHDMGVFIISPTEKGGCMHQPPDKLSGLCSPYSPMVFNDLYCLHDPNVHTLSIGAARPSDLVEHVAAVGNMEEKFPMVEKIEKRLIQTLEKALGTDWVHHWHEGLPRWQDTPGGINIPEILRLWTYAKGLDMIAFGKMRYNLMGNAGHWFAGMPAAAFKDEDLKPVLAKSRFADRIPGILREAHALLYDEPKKRLSES